MRLRDEVMSPAAEREGRGDFDFSERMPDG